MPLPLLNLVQVVLIEIVSTQLGLSLLGPLHLHLLANLLHELGKILRLYEAELSAVFWLLL